MSVKAMLRRALWAEALYEAYPNRFTLWIWSAAVNRLRKWRDSGIVKLSHRTGEPRTRDLQVMISEDGAASRRAYESYQRSLSALMGYQNVSASQRNAALAQQAYQNGIWKANRGR